MARGRKPKEQNSEANVKLSRKEKAQMLLYPSVLAFERKLEPSSGYFSQASKNDLNDKYRVRIKEMAHKGVMSSKAKDDDEAENQAYKPNLQKIDYAALDKDKDVLIIEWSLKVLPFNGVASVCNNSKFAERLAEIYQKYLEENGLSELSKRYAYNIINGRWLWRNRMIADSIDITISFDDKNLLIPNVKDKSLHVAYDECKELVELAEKIERGFRGEFCKIDIRAELIVGGGHEVYPSQDMILDDKKDKSRVLYEINGYAGLHPQKIGNAIRTIDNWYSDAQFFIPIEAYGSMTNLGYAFRQPSGKLDFYTLFENWTLNNAELSVDEKHYVMAMLIRGGVFGGKGD